MNLEQLHKMVGKKVVVYVKNDDPFPGKLEEVGADWDENDEPFEQVIVNFHGVLFQIPLDEISSVELAVDKKPA